MWPSHVVAMPMIICMSEMSRNSSILAWNTFGVYVAALGSYYQSIRLHARGWLQMKNRKHIKTHLVTTDPLAYQSHDHYATYQREIPVPIILFLDISVIILVLLLLLLL